jgi:2-polyprenyl-3-methyl-5-hydroxy-6-metoxy-1,4-benzoquinol methylase
MPQSTEQLRVPKPSQETCCPLCESNEGIEVGHAGRHNVPVRNVSCVTCGTVYVTPRPSQEQMAEFYRVHYRSQHLIPMHLDDGTLARPHTPEYDLAVEQRGQQQGKIALNIGETKPGERVLDVGCRRGLALRTMKQIMDIEAVGIEPGEQDAAIATASGIEMHVGVLETFDPGDNLFDQIQMFHVLEHVHDPLDCLIRLRSMLKPTGRLIIDVPDMMTPYGGLEWFFQYPHLYSFSRNTLMGLFRRAGLEPVRGSFAGTVILVGHPVADVGTLPLPFVSSMLSHPEHNGTWVANRLLTYNGLEKIRKMVKKGRPAPIDLIARLVRRPSLPIWKKTGMTHTCEAILEFVDILVKRRQFSEVCEILRAATQGPHDPKFIQQWQGALSQIEANILQLQAG